MIQKLKYYWDEVSYRALKTTRMVQGKALHVGLRTAMGGGAAAVAMDLSSPVREAMNLTQAGTQAAVGAGEIILSSTGGLVSIAAGAGINGYINHLEHKHNKHKLNELYRPQIAALTGKEPELVGAADLEAVAEFNPTLQDELKRNDRNRMVKNVASVAGTLVAFGVVFAAIALVPPLAPAVGAALFSGGLPTIISAGLLGYAGLQASRKVITSVGNKLLGLDKPSVEDKITALSKQHRRGVSIAPEQVMDIFVSAKPELAAEIREVHGKAYSALGVAEKRAVTAEYAEVLQTRHIADSLNEGQMNVRELTFRVHDQFSGVYPDDPWKDRVRELAQEKFDPLQDKLSTIRDEAVGKIQQWRSSREQSKLQDDVAKAIEEGRDIPEKAREVGNEVYWRNVIDAQRSREKTPDGQARG